MGKGDKIVGFFLVLLIVVMVAFLLGLLAYVVVDSVTPISCNGYQAASPELDFRWSVWTGCLVKNPYTGYFMKYSDWSATQERQQIELENWK